MALPDLRGKPFPKEIPNGQVLAGSSRCCPAMPAAGPTNLKHRERLPWPGLDGRLGFGSRRQLEAYSTPNGVHNLVSGLALAARHPGRKDGAGKRARPPRLPILGNTSLTDHKDSWGSAC